MSLRLPRDFCANSGFSFQHHTADFLCSSDGSRAAHAKAQPHSLLPQSDRSRGDELSIIGHFDRDKVEKILTNIIGNAVKFTEKGSVTVHVGRSDTPPYNLKITIKDTGVGIPADKLEKIFDRFYQVDSSATREQEGTGIGLALTSEFVKVHQGETVAASEEGKGSGFMQREWNWGKGFSEEDGIEAIRESATAVSNLSIVKLGDPKKV